MGAVTRLWHTLRWLRWRQVVFRVRRRIPFPLPNLAPPPSIRAPAMRWALQRQTSRWHPDYSFEIHGHRLRVLAPGDWNPLGTTALAVYNLHYFDDLASEPAHGSRDFYLRLLERWVAENPPGVGSGWDSYPVALRLINSAKWLWSRPEPAPSWLEHSLAVQARWLNCRLEHHLLGNHLWANAKGLLFAGILFEGNEADRWRASGLRILRRELAEQLLPDGGHFERSPTYHALFAEDLLDLVQLARTFPGLVLAVDLNAWLARIPRLLHWLALLSHPDGCVAHFNDVSQGMAPDVEDLRRYASDLGIDCAVPSGSELLANSGYGRLEVDSAVVLADVAPIGPDYIPGHAHADTLSFEMSVRGHRLFVNSGTSTYERSERRAMERGTAAHNTVIVDGADSSEVWASFRVARRARVSDVTWSVEARRQKLCASHDGYSRLPGRVLHRRCWELTPTALQISDSIAGFALSAEARFHLAPGWSARGTGEHVEIDGVGGHVSVRSSGADLRVEPAEYAARFGSIVPTQVIVASLNRPTTRVSIEWDAIS